MLDTLYNTLSAGRTPGKQDFNASKMFSLLEDPFGIWCFFHAPKEESVNEINRYENLKVRTDRNARDAWIKEEFPDVVFISGETDAERFKNTLKAMLEGKNAIANASAIIILLLFIISLVRFIRLSYKIFSSKSSKNTLSSALSLSTARRVLPSYSSSHATSVTPEIKNAIASASAIIILLLFIISLVRFIRLSYKIFSSKSMAFF